MNYSEDKKPKFHSDRSSFFTILPNLNFLGDNVAQGVAQGVAQDVAQDVAQSLAEIIIQEIQKNNKITREQIATIADVSKKTIERELKKMNNVRYIGSGASGYWKINQTN